MTNLTIAFKLLFIAALNVFLGSVIALLVFGEYHHSAYRSTVVTGPDWIELPLEISAWTLGCIVSGFGAYQANKLLLTSLFKDSKLINPKKNDTRPSV